MRLHELVDDVDEQPEPTNRTNGEDNGNGNGDNDNKPEYDDVFKAVAQHYDCDPEQIDDADEETRKKVYDMMDQCWDSEEDKVPDGCPIDIDVDDDSEDDEDVDSGKDSYQVMSDEI